MLKAIRRKKFQAREIRIAIVASRYNGRYVDAMLRAAKAELARARVKEIRIVRVPGAFEIPVVAARLARSDAPAYAAIVCLGVIFRGATTHAQHIGESVSRALAQIQVQFGMPTIHEVLLLENESQAKERCLNPKHNRGAEAAQTALQMAAVMRELA
jgi:6,7-dimethyl-8-ribityllumazine synthase